MARRFGVSPRRWVVWVDNLIMSRCKAVPIALRSIERRVLTARARRARGEQRDVVRARIVLAAADGQPNAAIARRLGVTEDTVRRWRGRFAAERLPGLDDRPRTGRPRIYSDVAAAEVKAMACALPAETGVALARWSSTELAAEAITRGVLATVSASTVRRWLNADAIKPWQHRSWIFPRDPDFAAKAARVLDLYARRFHDTPLRPDEYVISADEKTSIQARIRKHATTPPAPSQAARVEAEYFRGGSLAYLAAWDVHRARVFGRCEQTTGIDPFDRLVDQVMTTEPYATARRVFWVVDNGSSHRGQASIDRLQHRWPKLRLIHLPVHASWLNQVEIYFSVVQRKVVSPNDFHTLDEVEARLLDFQQYYEQIATPFEWKFTKDDLNALLQRIAAHEDAALTPAA